VERFPGAQRYESGRNDVLALLDSQRSSLEAGVELIEARRQRVDARVDLYLSLGGGFEAGEARPEREGEGDAGEEGRS
jgi:outer membrane protein TolC